MTMFAIEFFVGSKRGGWIKGRSRFTTREAAERDCTDRQVREVRAEMTVVRRRVVPA